MDKKTQLTKFGYTISNRRKALGYTMRELAEISGISPALIAKLENGTMPNFPKPLTIKKISDALKFDGELFFLADIFFKYKDDDANYNETPPEQQLREFLATKTKLNHKNVEQALYFISGLEKLQEIDELN